LHVQCQSKNINKKDMPVPFVLEIPIQISISSTFLDTITNKTTTLHLTSNNHHHNLQYASLNLFALQGSSHRGEPS
jgi:hypothetical protein